MLVCNKMLVLVVCVIAAAHAQSIQVNTTEGLIEGAKAIDGDYYVFFGVPYGGSVSGNNRFKAPTPPPAYPGLFHAMSTDVICAQPSPRGLIGIEDCLTLNVYTSEVVTPKPVLVWLNSEEYTTSPTTLHSFQNFIAEGTVIVKLNYRLSVFGFLCLGIPEAPGNAGIKDIIQGLQWIKNNIAAFGGDPNNVVLMGHGSGAALVDLITLSPKADNLVHKAIAISGSALAPWAVAYDPKGYAQILAEKLSYTGKSGKELAELLVSTDNNLWGSALDGSKFTNNTPLFAPCIEDRNLNDSVLIDAPINLLRAGQYNHIPYIAAYVTREGTLRAEQAAFEQWLEKMNANFTDFLQVDLDYGTNKTGIANSIRNFYFSASEINMATIQDYLDYHGDTLVTVSVIRGAKERAASSSEVRLMEFGYMGTQNSDWTYTQIPLNGVKHGGILNYLLNYDLTPNDEPVMKSLVKRFADFAYNRSLNPVATTNTTTNSSSWPAITSDRVYYFQYGGSSQNAIYEEQAKYDPHTIRMTFWDQLYATYYKAPSPVSSASSLSCLLSVVMCSFILLKLF